MRSATDLAGRSVLLTGATGGLGPELAKALAGRGLRLALTARDPEALAALRGRLSPGDHVTVPADLADADDRAGLVAAVEEAVGAVDVVVHNAAVDACAGIDQLTLEEIERIVEVNLTAPMDLVRRTVRGMMDRGRGHHVFVSSLSGYAGTAYQAPYAASKAGLVGLARSLRAEYIGAPVSFSVVAPGSIAGPGMFGRGQDAGVVVPSAMRLTTPAAVADAVLRALESRRPETVVYPGPIRPMLALGLLAPATSDRINERLGVGRLFEAAARARATGPR